MAEERVSPEPQARPFPRSLCHACAALRYVRGRATWFLQCTTLPQKYPPQPVARCAAFRPRT
ncbi:MAG: hypothetical protein EXS08_08810 [Planctomycetes bacterium]|nr:hypothetical protein [Planctomycetota bacterium]